MGATIMFQGLTILWGEFSGVVAAMGRSYRRVLGCRKVGLCLDTQSIHLLPRRAETCLQTLSNAPQRVTKANHDSTRNPSTFCQPRGNNPPRLARAPT